ncbi:hypothetical protein MLD38_034021 [Melastoma candidum]|uniref:Uncharacterized protein n=1 Tax=Melastoma candidum TaxID=119954 RepID=A0ACB9MAQ9_9MYRT|nr:hypothetical protein MLD38_034021 [Melastoma candidum]
MARTMICESNAPHNIWAEAVNTACYISNRKKPEGINEALDDPNYILAMQEELNQFERNKVWTLLPKPENRSIIGTKWVFRNKFNESGAIVRNKAQLVAKG